MKTYQSTTEETWVELLQVTLTEEQKALLTSTNEEDNEAKLALVNTLKAQREAAVDANKAQELISFYNTVKPELEETDVYQLISVDLTEANPFTGILNCRVNGEHKQIRF
jgi:hypothetical protein